MAPATPARRSPAAPPNARCARRSPRVPRTGSSWPGNRTNRDCGSRPVRTVRRSAESISRDFRNTISIIDSENHRDECNLVGTDETGLSAVGITSNGNALLLGCASTGNVIGGPNPENGNVFAAHELDGVQIVGGGCPPVISCSATTSAWARTARRGWATGSPASRCSTATGPTTIGSGSCPTGRGGLYNGNVIGANGTDVFLDANVSGVIIAADAIGTDATGVLDLGNFFAGVDTQGTATTIGGADPLARNRIAFNPDGGVIVSGPGALGVTVSRSSIFANGGLGIDLGSDTGSGDYLDGVTPNDPGDADSGPNRRQNFPVLQSPIANGANFDIGYAVSSPGTLTVEFFAADGASRQGRAFLGCASYALAGAATIASVPLGPVVPGTVVVATATDASGNTSEFSAPVAYGPRAIAPIPVVNGLPALAALVAAMLVVGATGLRRRRAFRSRPE